MRAGSAGRALTVAGLLGGAIALAFSSGGCFDRARLWAGVGAWALVAVMAVTVGRVLPREGPARAIPAGLLPRWGGTAEMPALIYLASLAACTPVERSSARRPPVRDAAVEPQEAVVG